MQCDETVHLAGKGSGGWYWVPGVGGALSQLGWRVAVKSDRRRASPAEVPRKTGYLVARSYNVGSRRLRPLARRYFALVGCILLIRMAAWPQRL
ncbi:hypothetical protein GCM10027022_05570 [Alpinimonas psychrophila]